MANTTSELGVEKQSCSLNPALIPAALVQPRGSHIGARVVSNFRRTKYQNSRSSRNPLLPGRRGARRRGSCHPGIGVCQQGGPDQIAHLKYRADIDGLRAVAVIAVVLYHGFPSLMPGGFIGVEIFFVISGYLITGIIGGGLGGPAGFSFADFYGRRIRKIFPALIAVVGEFDRSRARAGIARSTIAPSVRNRAVRDGWLPAADRQDLWRDG